jgi:hypothetical protein
LSANDISPSGVDLEVLGALDGEYVLAMMEFLSGEGIGDKSTIAILTVRAFCSAS